MAPRHKDAGIRFLNITVDQFRKGIPGPPGVMSDAAFIAAGIDEGGVVEMAHAEFLEWYSASLAWVF